MKPQFIVVTDSTGAYALLSKAVAEEFGYDKTQDDVTPDKFARMLAREREINNARKKKVNTRLSVPEPEYVPLMLGTDLSETVRGDDGTQAPNGPETDHSDVEGGQSILPDPPDESRGGSGDLFVPGEISGGNSGIQYHNQGAEISASEAFSIIDR